MGSGYSEEFGAKVGVRQVPVLHHCAMGFIQGAPQRLPLGFAVCR